MEEILSKLVELPTTNSNPAAINEALNFIETYLAERGMLVERFEFNGVESLVATTKQTKSPKVLLAAHVDVVDAPADQFKLRKENGYYTGRGVLDMKYAIAVYMQLVDDIKGRLQDYDFGIMITGDEEVAGPNGTGKLIEHGYRGGIVILPDAGESHDNWKLERSAKGFIYKQATASGVAIHGSLPWKGENAIYKIIDFVNDLRKQFPNQDHMGTTLNIGMINGGLAPNQVPAEASITLDIRVPSLDEQQRVEELLQETSQKYGVETRELLPSGAPHRPDLNSTPFLIFQECFDAVVKDNKLVPADSFGASDARFFAGVNVPCLLVNPPGEGLHADHESVQIEGVGQLKEILNLYLGKMAT
jgi:succinyl-diaminopimelate desuccinylase